jgi:hypothetical protein
MAGCSRKAGAAVKVLLTQGNGVVLACFTWFERKMCNLKYGHAHAFTRVVLRRKLRWTSACSRSDSLKPCISVQMHPSREECTVLIGFVPL